MSRLGKIVLCLLALSAYAFPARGQVFFSNTRVQSLTQTHASVGTSSAAAISSASVGSNILAWKVCADAGNSSYVAVGLASDVDTDGVRVGAGKCFQCDNCASVTLKNARVKGGASSQGYSVIQFKP